MNKVLYICREMIHMIRIHRVYFLAPILILLGILAILVFYIGPAVIISFIYAGA